MKWEILYYNCIEYDSQAQHVNQQETEGETWGHHQQWSDVKSGKNSEVMSNFSRNCWELYGFLEMTEVTSKVFLDGHFQINFLPQQWQQETGEKGGGFGNPSMPSFRILCIVLVTASNKDIIQLRKIEKRVTKMIKVLEHFSYEERMKGLGFLYSISN